MFQKHIHVCPFFRTIRQYFFSNMIFQGGYKNKKSDNLNDTKKKLDSMDDTIIDRKKNSENKQDKK